MWLKYSSTFLRKKIDRDFEPKLIHSRYGLGYTLRYQVMEIRKKISLQFTIIVGVIQLLLYFAIYISFAKSRVDQFYERLEAKATNLGQMLVDIDEINADLLRRIELNNPLSLPYERIIIYDHQNSEIFSNDTGHEIQMDSTVINQVRIDDRVRGKIGKYEYLGKFYISDKDRVVVFVAAIDLNGLKKLTSLRLILLLVFVIGLINRLCGRANICRKGCESNQ
jgi:hypothetical protein